MHLPGLLLLLATTGLVQPAAAAVYKYIDSTGAVTYTNIPVRGAVPVKLPALSASPAPKKTPAPAASAISGNYPDVDKGTQSQRDEGRRKILQQELANEETALAEAQRTLAAGKAPLKGEDARSTADRLKRLADAVAERERNCAAIRTELTRLNKPAPK